MVIFPLTENMAYLFRNLTNDPIDTKVLGSFNDTIDFYPWNNPAVVPYNITIHRYSDNRLETAAATTLCHDGNYVIRVGVPGLMFLAISNQGLLSLTSVPGDAMMMKPMGFNLILSRLFPAQITNNTGLNVIQNLALQNSGDGSMLGVGNDYLPIVLSNCQACGCLRNMNCGNNGLCRSYGAINVCNAQSLCGDKNGLCKGLCNDGSECRRENGRYVCRPNTTPAYIYVLIALALAVVIAVIMIGSFVVYQQRKNKPSTKNEYIQIKKMKSDKLNNNVKSTNEVRSING